MNILNRNKQKKTEEITRVVDDFTTVVDEALSLEVEILKARDGIMEHIDDLNKLHIEKVGNKQIEAKPESAD